MKKRKAASLARTPESFLAKGGCPSYFITVGQATGRNALVATFAVAVLLTSPPLLDSSSVEPMRQHAAVTTVGRGQRCCRRRDFFEVGALKEGRDARCWEGGKKTSLYRKYGLHRSCHGRRQRPVKSCSREEGMARPFVRRRVLGFCVMVSSRSGVPNALQETVAAIVVSF
ncbi:hypothetical protein MTO96_050548 [Rhipicephalus appendiculatus]